MLQGRANSNSEHYILSHKHSVNNPYSQFRDEYTLDDIKKSPMVYEPLTKLQCW
jgi:acetyl-CoA acyltransferase